MASYPFTSVQYRKNMQHYGSGLAGTVGKLLSKGVKLATKTAKSAASKAKNVAKRVKPKPKAVTGGVGDAAQGAAKKSGLGKKVGMALGTAALGIAADSALTALMKSNPSMSETEARKVLAKSTKAVRDAGLIIGKSARKKSTKSRINARERAKKSFYTRGRSRRMVKSDQFGSGRKHRSKKKKKSKKTKKRASHGRKKITLYRDLFGSA